MPAVGGAAPWPLLLFSPGLGVPVRSYSKLASDLASHGFMVVGVPHPGSLPPEYPEMAAAVATGLVAALDDIEAQHSALFARADLTRIGVLGHSMGGAGAAIACRMDRRFKAGMDMDGTVFGSAVADGVPLPFLLFTADLGYVEEPKFDPVAFDATPGRGRLYEELLFTRSPTAYWASVDGLRHMSFTDDDGALNIVERVGQSLGYFVTGPDTRRLAAQYAVAFFGRFVRGADNAGYALAVPRSPRVRLLYHWRTP